MPYLCENNGKREIRLLIKRRNTQSIPVRGKGRQKRVEELLRAGGGAAPRDKAGDSPTLVFEYEFTACTRVHRRMRQSQLS